MESARASVTGSAVPMASFSYGGGEEENTENIDTVNTADNGTENTETPQPDQGGGNTVTFGGVETFATNSTVASTTPGGSEDQSMDKTPAKLPPLENAPAPQVSDPVSDQELQPPTLPHYVWTRSTNTTKLRIDKTPAKLPPLENAPAPQVSDPVSDQELQPPTLPPIDKDNEKATPKMTVNPDNVRSRGDVVLKPYLNAVVIGHEASGKSTVSGRLVYECDGIDEELMTKFEREANQAGKNCCKYAWIMDKLQAERERGISIDTKLRRLETRHFYVNVIDAPGHVDYVHNMITGSSQADVAVLVVSAKAGEFENSATHEGQAREHLHLAYTMGVKQLIVAVNKMDVTKPPYSQKRYDFIVTNVDLLARKAGFDPESVVYVPISGWKGDNLVKRSENLNWFKMWQIERKSGGASGRTLLDALDNMEQPTKLENYPFRMAVHSVYKLGTAGIVAAGRIHSGSVKPGMMVTFGPSDHKVKVRAVQLHHDAVTEGLQGENVGLQIEGLDIKDIRKGFLCGDTNNDPPKMVQEFLAQMVILQHPGVIKRGYTPMMHCHTVCVPVKFSELRERCDRRTGAMLEESPTFLKSGDAAVVELIPAKPVCLESFFDYPSLGRFVIRDQKQTIGIGVVVEIPGRERPPQTDDDKWAEESIQYARRPQTTGGRSVTFSIPQHMDDYEQKNSKNYMSLHDEPTFRTQSGKLETEL